MTGDLILYTNPMSRGRIARWMLEETGAAYRTEILEHGPMMKSEPYIALNPMGKVPAIRHGDTVVTEAAAICAYLANAFPDAGLAPRPATVAPTTGGSSSRRDRWRRPRPTGSSDSSRLRTSSRWSATARTKR